MAAFYIADYNSIFLAILLLCHFSLYVHEMNV